MPIETQYTYKPLVSSTEPAFNEFFEIYVEALPLRERKPRDQIAAITTNPCYKILLLTVNNEVIGFSMLFAPPDESFCLLEYMAVRSDQRNQGLGGALFLRTFQNIVAIRGPVFGLVEVDSDREPSSDQAIRKRRQLFYRRLGCLRIDGLSYVLPLPGKGEPPQMDIFVYLKDSAPIIRKQQLNDWLKAIYSRVYACAPDDPRIARMMETVSDPVKIV